MSNSDTNSNIPEKKPPAISNGTVSVNIDDVKTTSEPTNGHLQNGDAGVWKLLLLLIDDKLLALW